MNEDDGIDPVPYLLDVVVLSQRPKLGKRPRGQGQPSPLLLAGLNFILTGMKEDKPLVDPAVSATTSPARLPPRVMHGTPCLGIVGRLRSSLIVHRLVE